MHQVETSCIVGSLPLFGPATYFRDLTSAESQTALREGHALCLAGADVVGKVLDDVIAQATRGERNGLKAIFGRLLNFLGNRRDKTAFFSLREQLVLAAHRNGLYSRSTRILLGVPTPLPTIWTALELANQLGTSPKLVSDLVAQLGFEVQADRIPDQIARELLAHNGVANAIAAAEILGVRPKVLKGLTSLGIAHTALERHSRDGKPLRLYWRNVLDAFRSGVLANCRNTSDASGSELVSLALGAQAVGRSASYLYDILHSRSCDWAYAKPGVVRLDAIMVDVVPLRAAVSQPVSMFSVRDVATIIGVDRTNISQLAKAGILRHERHRNPVNLRPQVMIPEDGLFDFQSEYMAVTALSRGRTAKARAISQYLAGAGIASTPTVTKFYRRRDLLILTGMSADGNLVDHLMKVSSGRSSQPPPNSRLG